MPRDEVVDALALHAWGGAMLLDDRMTPPPPAGAEGWQLFLRVDACALPLSQRLHAQARPPAVAAPLPPPIAKALSEHAMREARQLLSARRQLQLLVELSRRHALPVVVLKGGVSVAAGRSLELKDLDVLAAPGRARELAAALDGLGYEALDDGPIRDAVGAPHLTGRIVPGGIRIEIHEWLAGMPPAEELFARAEPLAGHPALLQLGAADHLWHIVHHIAIQHPERRGRLRDRLLLRDAVAACDATALGTVRERIAASARRAPLEATLAGASSEAGHPFDDAVAARLALLARFPRYKQHAYWRHVIDHALAFVSTERSWHAELLDGRAEERRLPSAFRPVAWAESLVPPAGRAARYALIGVRALIAAPVAAYGLSVGRRARRLTQRT